MNETSSNPSKFPGGSIIMNAVFNGPSY
jgi:hypothetical protein